MIKEILTTTEEKMKKTISVFQQELATLRAGRAVPSLLNKINVDYYGVSTPLKQLANISAPEPRLLLVQPWDKNSIKDIEKAILKSDLGLTPSNDGNIIRLVIPELTEERRRDLVKFIRKKAEEGRVGIRNIRREANEEFKLLQKNGEISEDRFHRTQEDIQKITDNHIKKIDEVLNQKENEIIEI